LREAVTLRRQRGNIFIVTVGDYTAARARRICESMADQFVQTSKASQLEAVRATQEFSVEQGQIYKRRVEASEAKLEAAKRAAVSSNLMGGAVNGANLQTARGLLDQANIEVEEQRQRVNHIRGEFPSEVRENDPTQLSTSNVTRLAGQVVSL